MFQCRNCFAFVSLFNNVDISSSNIHILLSRLYPVGRKYPSNEAIFIPRDLALKVNINGSLVVSSLNQSRLCKSKFYKISKIVCTHLSFNEYIGQIKPWNFQQYVYLLPNQQFKINTLWLRKGKYEETILLPNVIGIVVSTAEQNQAQWKLKEPKFIREVSSDLRENILLFLVNFETPKHEKQILLVLPISKFRSPVAYQWTKIALPDFICSISLTKIQHIFDDQLVIKPNISTLNTPKRFQILLRHCSENLIFSAYLKNYSIDSVLMCLKSKVLWQ